MECTAIRDWLFRKIDEELSDQENEDLKAHLAQCSACAGEYNLLALPHRIAVAVPAYEPSAYFSQKLSARIAGEAQNNSFWLAILNPARSIVPALATITLLLLSIFAYFQIYSPKTELYTAYERVFIADPPHQAHIQNEVTDESILSAIAEWEIGNRNYELK